MRTFFIFNVNSSFAYLMKENPYNLFSSLENLYYLDDEDLNIGINFFEHIIVPFDKEKINNDLFEKNKNNDNYTITKNKHRIFNKYKNEYTNIEVKLSYLVLKTNKLDCNILRQLNYSKDLFLCDFKNKDYFFLDKLCTIF